MSDLYEFHPPGRLARVRATPLREALRGEWTARLDPRTEIAAAALPEPLPSLIYTVVRSSRLWRRERLDVARELIAHFSDGLATGRSAEKLAEDFGSPEQAARLIRRAKLRARPLAWQSWRLLMRSLLVLLAVAVVGYAWLSARFYLSKPLLAHNYVNEVNTARRLPESDRAWPIYRQALLKMGKHDANWIDTERIAEGPGGKDWNEAVALLARHRDAVEMVRQGAKKPRLGYYLGDPNELAAAQAADGEWLVSSNQPLAEKNPEMISMPLEGPQNCRSVARLLAADARVAAVAGQGATVAADLTAMIKFSDQLFEPRATLVEQLIGMAIFGITVDNLGRILAETPAVLDDGQLRDLAHRIAAWRGGKLNIDFTAERMLFDDVIQRAYSDDGHGNGRITAAGLKILNELNNASGLLSACNPRASSDLTTALAGGLLSPGVAALVGNRHENRRLYNETLDDMIALHQGVPWQWDRAALDAHDERFRHSITGTANRFRHSFVALLLPALSSMFVAAERQIQVRDAAEVGIALEIWHRRHGEWPAKLDVLVPDLLPAVPPDRFDGKPLRYVVRDGHPVVYSVGNDRKDDGGRPTPNPNAAIPRDYGPLSPEEKKSPIAAEQSGDWILWPPLPEEMPEPESPPADAELIPE